MKPKKLIREKISEFIPNECENIVDQDELNRLYELKINEEVAEIKQSDHKDIMEFVDLIEAAHCFAIANGFTVEEIGLARAKKREKKGVFSNIALNNLNPMNPSNMLYFVDNYNY